MNKYSQEQSSSLDKNYINAIYSHLTQKINLLDQLTQQYKKKQEVHFLKTFMGVIQKLGNQLIFAQEAYKNVDLQAKKDSYCLQLAEQLNFFKSQSINLSNQLNATNEELKKVKLDKQNIQTELNFTRNLYEKQTKNTLKIKNQIKELKKQLKNSLLMPNNGKKNSVITSQPFEKIDQSKKQLTSLGKKLTFKKSSNPQSMEFSEQQFTLKNFETNDTFEFDKKNRNSMTLTPVKQIGRLSQNMSITQRDFRTRKHSRQLGSKLPKQYFGS